MRETVSIWRLIPRERIAVSATFLLHRALHPRSGHHCSMRFCSAFYVLVGIRRQPSYEESSWHLGVSWRFMVVPTAGEPQYLHPKVSPIWTFRLTVGVRTLLDQRAQVGEFVDFTMRSEMIVMGLQRT